MKRKHERSVDANILSKKNSFYSVKLSTLLILFFANENIFGGFQIWYRLFYCIPDVDDHLNEMK